MPFKQFLIAILAGCIGVLTVIAVLPRLGLARANAEMVWVAYLYANKERIAAAIPGPRVFVVGGSATLHSFDSATASRRLGMPVVNFGTHAALGLGYILERAERVLRPGDIVLLAPEYTLLQQPDGPNSYKTQLITFYDPDYISKAPLTDWPNYIIGYDVIPSVVEALKVKLKGVPPFPYDLVQDDLGNNRGYTVDRSVAQIQLASLNPPAAVPITESAHALLARFASFAASRHIKVFVIPVSLLKTPSYPGPDYERYLQTLPAAYAKMQLSMLGTPDMAYMTVEDTHDVPFHANDRGRIKYTATMLSLVCRHLRCS